jgi:CheY-like chemotaxis protein
MSEKNNSSNGELILSRNHSLTIKRLDLVRRGLQLFYEIQNVQSINIISIQPRILIVDDDKSIVSVCSDYFGSEGYDTYAAHSSEEALEILAKKSVDIVITGVNQPVMSGLELTKLIKEKYDSEVIIFTGYREGCSQEKARSVGAFELFYKPVKLVDLLNSVKKVVERRLPTSRGSKQF